VKAITKIKETLVSLHLFAGRKWLITVNKSCARGSRIVPWPPWLQCPSGWEPLV